MRAGGSGALLVWWDSARGLIGDVDGWVVVLAPTHLRARRGWWRVDGVSAEL
jgi:hypothetical protein